MAELVYTLTQIAASMSEERRKALRYITVHWAAGSVESRWNFAISQDTTPATGDVQDFPGVSSTAFVAPQDEEHALTPAVPMEEQIRDLADSGLIGALDASRIDSGAAAVRAGYWAAAWNIVPWYQRPMGRPRLYTEPRQRLTLELPQTLVEQIDTLARAAGMTRTAWIDAAIREKLGRDNE